MFDYRNPKPLAFYKKPKEQSSRIISHADGSSERKGWSLGLPSFVQYPESHLPFILAVGGGKGGVGKSFVSANLAAKLAQLGFRVLIVDLDIGCANLHTHFGLSMPERSLADFVVFQRCNFKDILTATPIPGLGLAAGGREEIWAEYLEQGAQNIGGLFQAIFSSGKDLQVDFVVFDLGAGTHCHTMNFFSAAHLGIVTVLPEPTSIENAYVFLRTFLWQIINHVGDRTNNPEAASDVKDSLSKIVNGTLTNTYSQCLRQMAGHYGQFISDIMSALRARKIGIIVNQTRSQSDIDIGPAMEHICNQYFGFISSYLGYLNYDDAAWKSLRNRRLLVQDFPHSLLVKRLTKVLTNGLNLLGVDGG